VLLEKVDTLEKIEESLTKSVIFVKFSCYGDATGISSLVL
jgi:hypothetical protein